MGPATEPTGPCPSEKDLVAFLAGEVDPTSLLGIQQHLDTCERCLKSLDGLVRRDHSPIVQALRNSSVVDQFLNEPDCQQVVREISQGIMAPRPATVPVSPTPLTKLGSYQIEGVIAEGGMGIIYRAVHVDLLKPVALKTLRPILIHDRNCLERFRRECRALGRLQHHNLVTAFDAGVVDVTPFLVMEYVDGIDLAKLLKRRKTIPLPEACEIIRQAAIGLEHAWSKSLIHRDVKPSNLMLTQDASGHALVKVLDLGLARLLDPKTGIFPDAGDLTSEGQVVGTRGYMAPEQARNSHDVDVRVDVYALGVTLHELLLGRIPAMPVKAGTDLTALETELPSHVCRILESLLAAKREGRPSTPGEVAAMIEPLAVGHRLEELLKAVVQQPEA